MYICYNLSCVIHICAYMNVYIVHKVDHRKGRKVGRPITALSFPKKNVTTASKKYNVFIQLIIFHLKENYTNPTIPPVGKYVFINQIRLHNLNQLNPFVGPVATYLRLGLLPHQHWLPLEISRGFRACRFR